MPMSIGGGAAAGLEAVLARRFREQLEKQRAAEQQQAFALQQQRLAQDASQFDRTLELNTRRFDADQVDAEFLRNLRQAEIAMAGTRFAQGIADTEAEREAEANWRAAQLAMRGTEMANANAQKALDRASTLQAIHARLAGSQPDPPPGPSPYAQERTARTIQTIDDLLPQIDHSTAGAGASLANLPVVGGMTDAGAVRAKLQTLAANIAFNELAQMREASKTGGALGQISERELDLLSNSLGAIQQNQHPDVLRAELQKMRESLVRWQQALQMHGGEAAQAGLGGAASPAGGSNIESLRSRYGY